MLDHLGDQRQVDVVGGATDRFDEYPLVRFLVETADEAAVDLQVGQAEVGEVADQAEAAAEVLQAEAVAGFAQRLAQRLDMYSTPSP